MVILHNMISIVMSMFQLFFVVLIVSSHASLSFVPTFLTDLYWQIASGILTSGMFPHLNLPFLTIIFYMSVT